MIDPLSDVLRCVRLTGGVFLDSVFTAPWCITAKIEADDCRPFLTRPAQVIAYHHIVEGELVVSVAGQAPLLARAGEIILLPRNDCHVLGSAPGLKSVEARDLFRPSLDGGLASISHGGGGAVTRIVCGFLGSEDGYNPLMETLPQVLKLDLRSDASRAWIEASFRFASAELAAGRAASPVLLSRLSELLLVEAVRQYSTTLAEEDAGWLKGLRDPQIGRALALIHRDIGAAWSAEALAQEVGMSRSAFMDHFRLLVGMPPIRYLTILRLQAARLQLRETSKSISQIGHGVGYESEEAFSRAFKREFGLAPAHWREREAATALLS
jgi:AraC-like DNA-binding protein